MWSMIKTSCYCLSNFSVQQIAWRTFKKQCKCLVHASELIDGISVCKYGSRVSMRSCVWWSRGLNLRPEDANHNLFPQLHPTAVSMYTLNKLHSSCLILTLGSCGNECPVPSVAGMLFLFVERGHRVPILSPVPLGSDCQWTWGGGTIV